MTTTLPRTLVLVAMVVLATWALPNRAAAVTGRAQDSDACDRAAHQAAEDVGVPLPVLKAIARTESGITVAGRFIPWPWTVNVEGKGVRLTSKDEAMAYVRQNRDLGATNIDVGCFQINHRWHGEAFPNLDTMMDPQANARYAARFLLTLYGEFGDWTKAAGAFHSRNQETSTKYLARYVPILQSLKGGATNMPTQAETTPRENQFPLLIGGSSSGSRGSLFPAGTAARGSLLGFGNS